MDEDQKRRHLCRECDMSFSDGRVLGGHMRGHMIRRNATEKNNKKILKEGIKDNEGYVMRENPKKSSIDPNPTPKSSLYSECRICGKGFASDKALFGHMRLHSTRGEKKMKKAMESDLIGYCPVRGKRSIRVHYDADEENAKEVAFCLMMLSRGVRNMEEGCDSFDKLVENEVAASDKFSENIGLEMMESQSAESSSSRNCVRDQVQKRASKHKCSICRKRFVSARALGSHKRLHTMKNTTILGAAKKVAVVMSKEGTD